MEIISNCILFTFDLYGVFKTVRVNGDMTLYTDSSNFLGRDVRDVLPEKVATATKEGITECVRTGDAQFEYELGGKRFHVDMERTFDKDHQCDGVWATVTRA